MSAKAPEGRRKTMVSTNRPGRGIAPVKAKGTTAPEGRRNILLIFRVLQGRGRCWIIGAHHRLLSPLRGYIVGGGRFYRGDAPAYILSPLRGLYVHHNRPKLISSCTVAKTLSAS